MNQALIPSEAVNKVAPPATKREVLLATARVVSAQRKRMNLENNKEREKASEKFQKEAERIARKLLKTATVSVSSWRSGYAEVDFKVTLQMENNPTLKALRDARDVNRPMLETDERKIYEELRIASRNGESQTDRINALVSDKAISAALLKAGVQLLASPSSITKEVPVISV